ncbi:MAG: response regulator [Planctomycetota bacterium]
MDVKQVVFVISGDSKARRNLSLRLKRLGCELRLCHSPEEFQQNSSPHDAGCILLHVAHADVDLDLLTTLGQREDHWPVIGIAAEADVETAVLTMKRGAFDFLLETCSDQRLRAVVEEAFHWDDGRRKRIADVQLIRRRLKQLAPPLRDVLDLLRQGKSNRAIAEKLGMSVRSIEVRRAKVMETMKARTLATLLRQMFLVFGSSRPSSIPAEDSADELDSFS